MLKATHEQLERLIEAAQSLEAHARDWADELIDREEDEIYKPEIDKIEASISRFNIIRRELEGVQLTIGSV